MMAPSFLGSCPTSSRHKTRPRRERRQPPFQRPEALPVHFAVPIGRALYKQPREACGGNDERTARWTVLASLHRLPGALSLIRNQGRDVGGLCAEAKRLVFQ